MTKILLTIVYICIFTAVSWGITEAIMNWAIPAIERRTNKLLTEELLPWINEEL